MSEKRKIFTGRRKSSVARVRIEPGDGKIIINKMESLSYLKRKTLQKIIEEPFTVLEALGKFNIIANVNGGGLSGQAGAVRLGIARGLIDYDPEFRTVLKKAGFLTRDSREVERKKYGLAGARRKFQFSKR
ncbi:MAG: 30S ribosomal protein S9 [Calditrichaeota bacterium]|nr:MAG: 30S ribosomal protein S9 [Calditrichota bacterium]